MTRWRHRERVTDQCKGVELPIGAFMKQPSVAAKSVRPERNDSRNETMKTLVFATNAPASSHGSGDQSALAPEFRPTVHDTMRHARARIATRHDAWAIGTSARAAP
jgi:hypothetical protein